MKLISEILDAYFPDPQIPLLHQDPYTLLIAVLLSAQCTDKRVNEVTPVLFSKANSPAAMVELSIEEIQAIIRSCGLSRNKSRAIWNLSKQLLELHQGEVPADFPSLEALPGVGHKTASVVMSQAFHLPAFPVDTHIHRCAQRWNLSCGTSVAQTEKDLKRVFPEKDWHKRHLQIIYFARKFCPAKSHKISLCPMCSAMS